MDKIKQNILLALLITFSFTSSLSLVLQTYDYRDSFSKLDQLKLEKQDLYFKESKLIEEVEYYKNHISLREVAVNSLGMRSPAISEVIVVTIGESR